MIISNPLEEIIIKLIEERNFITLEEFISLALTHPQYGYYCNNLPIGKEKDFITAPEISQLFGEMLAFWVISKWQSLGEPNSIHLIELGPGNGTLMLDILNIITKVPKLNHSIKLILVEINNKLKLIQENKLNPILQKYNIKAVWVKHINEINYINNKNNLIPHIIIANEFLDALPIKQFKYINNKWHEVIITLKNQHFHLALNKAETNIKPFLEDQITYKDHMVFEYSPKALDYINKIVSLIIKNKGYATIIDYGYIENTFTNTIQSISKHIKTNYLKNIGNQDITYLVNFPLIIKVLTELNSKHNLLFNISTQNKFLINLGIKQRTQKLLENANTFQKNAIISGVERILDTNNMGSLFKVLEITYN